MGEPTAPTQPARDQLSLSLEAELPRLPASLRPMLARPLLEPFDSPDHLFEPSWAGVRALAFCDAADRGALRLLDSEGTDLASRLPELADLCSRLMATSAVVDGELVVVDAGGIFRRREALRRTLTPGESVVAVPAIATEGRALHDAVVAQGIAGVMARQRTGPYLPGIRSRLWRFIPATSAGQLTPFPDQQILGLAPASGSSGPVLALIRRLPLDEDA